MKNSTPLWQPSHPTHTRLYEFMTTVNRHVGTEFDSYEDLWAWSVNDPATFWAEVWDFVDIIGDRGTKIIEPSPEMRKTKFFPEARINWAENLLRRRDDVIAIISRIEKKGETEISFAMLAKLVSQLQQYLKSVGVQKGDRVAGYLPNITHSVIGALATASLGAIWCSASPDFGVQGILDRFGQIAPKVLITTDGYFYSGKTIDNTAKLTEILPQIPSIETTIIIPLISDEIVFDQIPNSISWIDALTRFEPMEPSFERVEFNHPLFIMFSSGTTGAPKCIVHGHGGTLITHMKEHQLQCDVRVNDRVFYFTTCGWMMWNWQISALASGATLILYDGSPFFPKAEMLWEYTSRHGATLFGTGAKYIDALKAHSINIKDNFDLSYLRTITSTGSPLVHESFDYVYANIKSDVHLASVSGGTDIISCFVIGNPISPVYRGEIQGAGLGYNIAVYNSDGQDVTGEAGELICQTPFPSMPVCFWNDPADEKYKKAYFDHFNNVWCHGDWIERTEHGGFIITGRSDATLNPGGVRIGTAEIYRQVEQIPEILESIAVGQNFNNDERVVLFVRLKDGFELNDDLKTRIKNQIKSGASPRHVPAKIIAVADIPRTKSNKIVELAVKEIIHNRPVRNVEALANPEALDLYKDLVDLAS